jgi:hypothetical protein
MLLDNHRVSLSIALESVSECVTGNNLEEVSAVRGVFVTVSQAHIIEHINTAYKKGDTHTAGKIAMLLAASTQFVERWAESVGTVLLHEAPYTVVWCESTPDLDAFRSEYRKDFVYCAGTGCSTSLHGAVNETTASVAVGGGAAAPLSRPDDDDEEQLSESSKYVTGYEIDPEDWKVLLSISDGKSDASDDDVRWLHQCGLVELSNGVPKLTDLARQWIGKQ